MSSDVRRGAPRDTQQFRTIRNLQGRKPACRARRRASDGTPRKSSARPSPRYESKRIRHVLSTRAGKTDTSFRRRVDAETGSAETGSIGDSSRLRSGAENRAGRVEQLTHWTRIARPVLQFAPIVISAYNVRLGDERARAAL